MSKEKLESIAMYLSSKEKKKILREAKSGKQNSVTGSNFLRQKCGLPLHERGAPSGKKKQEFDLKELLPTDEMLDEILASTTYSENERKLLHENAYLKKLLVNVIEQVAGRINTAASRLDESKNILDYIKSDEFLKPNLTSDSKS